MKYWLTYTRAECLYCANETINIYALLCNIFNTNTNSIVNVISFCSKTIIFKNKILDLTIVQTNK